MVRTVLSGMWVFGWVERGNVTGNNSNADVARSAGGAVAGIHSPPAPLPIPARPGPDLTTKPGPAQTSDV